MAYIGGIRARLVKDSTYFMLKKALTDLHWFDADRDHTPINFVPDAIPENVEIPLNTMSLADEDMFTTDQEMGSGFTEQRWGFVVDFYAEGSAVGLHLSNDVAAILDGRFPSIGRTDPQVDVKDYSLGGANPPNVFTCQIENVMVGHARGWSKPYQQYWYYVTFDVLDYYWNENDA